jgi:hypothetical protein
MDFERELFDDEVARDLADYRDRLINGVNSFSRRLDAAQ